MRKRTEVEIRMSEIRESLNADEAPANADALKVEYRACETEYRGILQAEQAADAKRRANKPDGEHTEDGEGTEFRALLDRVEVRSYLSAASKGRDIAGGGKGTGGKSEDGRRNGWRCNALGSAGPRP